MLDSKIEVALNDQVNAELWSSYFYLSMSCDMGNKGFEGMALWFDLQAKEEYEHATRIINFIGDMDGKVLLMPIEGVKQEWSTPSEAFEDTLKHEKIVTSKIHNLMDIAIEVKDYTTQSMLKWFVDEQVQEENTVRKILDKFKLIEGNSAGLYDLDKELGSRTVTDV